MFVYYIRKIFYVFGVSLCIAFFSYQCAYFNTFYNAEKSFEKAVKIIQNAPLLEEDKLPAESITLLNEVINNCDIVIKDYSDSRYVDKAYFLKGVSYFYKKTYDLSIENFQALLNNDASVYYDKAILWSTYSFLRLEDINQSKYYLDQIVFEDLDNEDLYVYYNIKAELSESTGDMESAYENYMLASDVTNNDFRKIYIYRKLIYLSELSGDLLSKTRFIKLLEPYVENLTELRNLKIEWIDGKKSIGDFKDVVEEIDLIISQSEFQSIKPKLMLHKSKAYRQLGKISLSKDVLNDLVSEYSRKDETSEAYYILGNMFLFEEFDLEKSKEYYQKSIDEKSRSSHAKKAKNIKNKIDRYEELISDIEYFSSNSSIDTTAIKTDLNNMNMSLPEFEGEVKIDSLIFEIGQIFYFDFNQIDSAMIRYQYIVDKFSGGDYSSQASNILSYHQNPDLFSSSPDSSLVDANIFGTRRDSAWNISNISMQKDYYKDLYNDYGDSVALFNLAYIEDLFLYNTSEAVSIYNKIKIDYPNHTNMKYIDERLSAIESSIGALIKENDFILRFNDALQLANSSQLDSARTILENIVVSRKSSSYQSVNNLITQIDKYDDFNKSYIQKASDSLIYEMAEIEYSYFYNDLESQKKFKKIIDDFPESNYRNQAAWILNEIFDASPNYKIDDIDYTQIDTSINKMSNPIAGVNIEKTRLDSIKLNEILLNFEKN